MMKKIFIIHENDEWTSHLTRRLDELKLPYESWHLHEGQIDLSSEPPVGVFYNRMSASSHTRGHRYAPELAGAVIDWLEFHGRKVINGSNAIRLELSKVKQYVALEKQGIKTPKTIAAVGKNQVLEAAKTLGITPFIIKHNRAGKGLGVNLFQSVAGLEFHLKMGEFEESIDGLTLIQEYIESPGGFITRSEFINGKYLYSVQVRTDEGFQLCPADACQIGEAFCPISGEALPKDEKTNAAPMKFKIVDNPRIELIKAYEAFLKESSIDVAGIEFIVDGDGIAYTYDVNTNTNYNADAESEVNTFAMLELAKYLQAELEAN